MPEIPTRVQLPGATADQVTLIPNSSELVQQLTVAQKGQDLGRDPRSHQELGGQDRQFESTVSYPSINSAVPSPSFNLTPITGTDRSRRSGSACPKLVTSFSRLLECDIRGRGLLSICLIRP